MDYNKIILIAVFFIAAFAAFFMGVGLAYCHDADMADYFSVEGFTNIRLELHEDGEINLDGEMVGWHTHQWCYDYMSERGIVQGAAQHSWYQDELPKVEPPPPPMKPDPPVKPPMPSALEKHLADTPDYHYHSEHVDAGEHTHRGHAHGIHAWHEHNALVHSHPPKTVEPPPTPPPVVNPPVDPPVDPPVEPPVNPPKEEVKPTKPMREQVPPHTHNFLPPHEEHEANGPHAHYYGHHSHDGYRGHGHSYGLFHTHTEPETPSPPKVSVANMPRITATVPVEAGMPIPVATSEPTPAPISTHATVDNPNNFIIPATVTTTPVDVAEVVEVVSPTAPQPDVDIVSVEFRENPDRLIVEVKNNMDTPFVFFDGCGKWELYRSNGRLFCSLMFRHVNLTFKDKTKPILMPGETTRLYLASIADYNALLPLYAEENVTHYMDFSLKGYKTRQSLMLQYRVNGVLESMDTYPEPVASAPMLYPKPITMWGELKR